MFSLGHLVNVYHYLVEYIFLLTVVPLMVVYCVKANTGYTRMIIWCLNKDS